MHALLLRLLVLGTALATASPGFADVQLLTKNAGFEDSADKSFPHGPGVMNGWEVENFSYAAFGPLRDCGPEGTWCFGLKRGGRLTTAEDARATVQPGRAYELEFAARRSRDAKPTMLLGALPTLLFYDASGALVQRRDGLPVLLAGVTEWARFRLRAVAPPGAVRAGVQVLAGRGGFPNEDFRDVLVDDFKLREVPESAPAVFLRSAPLALQSGTKVRVAVRWQTPGAEPLTVRLMREGKTLGESKVPTAIGRAVDELEVALPSSLAPADDYVWEAQLGAATARQGGAFFDPSVEKGPRIAANHPRIVLHGRWENAGSEKPRLTWHGGQIRARFTGTSVKLRGSTNGKGVTFKVVLDGGDAPDVRHNVTIQGKDQTVTLAEGLSDGPHTLVIHREDEVGPWFEFGGLELKASAGLLRPERAARRIEVFGDSVSSSAPFPKVESPGKNSDNKDEYFGSNYFVLGHVLGRTFGAESRTISKGATGVAGGFVFKYNLGGEYPLQGGVPWEKTGYQRTGYWDRAAYNGFETDKAPAYDLASWKPDAVLVSIGHNDQFGAFNGPAETKGQSAANFRRAYIAFLEKLRATYPDAHIFCTNTVLTNAGWWHAVWHEATRPGGRFEMDANVHWQFFNSTCPHPGHPTAADHAAMAHGSRDWPSVVEWMGDVMHW